MDARPDRDVGVHPENIHFNLDQQDLQCLTLTWLLRITLSIHFSLFTDFVQSLRLQSLRGITAAKLKNFHEREKSPTFECLRDSVPKFMQQNSVTESIPHLLNSAPEVF